MQSHTPHPAPSVQGGMSVCNITMSLLAASVLECRPILSSAKRGSADEVLYAMGPNVHVIDNETGKELRVFSGHGATVRCIQLLHVYADSDDLDSKCSDFVISSSADGEVIIWNRYTLVELESYKTKLPIFDIFVTQTFCNQIFFSEDASVYDENKRRKELYLVIKRSDEKDKKLSGQNSEKKNNQYKLIIYDAVNEKIRKKVQNLQYGWKNISHINVDKCEYILVGNKRKLQMWSVEEKSFVGRTIFCDVGDMSCISAKSSSSKQPILVSGHDNGKIAIWHNIYESIVSIKVKPVCSVLHWHAHMVLNIVLSEDGNYLYSGGPEGVIVVWQLATGYKMFIPHLGSAVVSISRHENDPKLVVSLADNSIASLDTASLDQVWTFKAPLINSNYLDYVMGKGGILLRKNTYYSCTVHYDESTGHVMSNGYPAHLQSLDLSLKRGVSHEHKISPFSFRSKIEATDRLTFPLVTYFDIFHNKQENTRYMATVDVEKIDVLIDSSLKFWECDDSSGSDYKLTSQILNPHGPFTRLTSVLLVPAVNGGEKLCCVTGSSNGSLKCWRLTESTKVGKNAAHSLSSGHWTCIYSFSSRDSAVDSLSLSPDASLLVIGQQNLIQLFDLRTFCVIKSIVNCCNNNIIFTNFIEPKDSGASLLVIGTRRTLSVYDIFKNRFLWCTYGNFTSFNVAKSEVDLVHSGNGWIAAATMPQQYSNNEIIASNNDCNRFDSNSAGGVDVDIVVSFKKIATENHEIHFFSPFSEDPLQTFQVSDKVLSMTFTKNAIRGPSLVAACLNGQILEFQRPSPKSSITSSITVAQVANKDITPGKILSVLVELNSYTPSMKRKYSFDCTAPQPLDKTLTFTVDMLIKRKKVNAQESADEVSDANDSLLFPPQTDSNSATEFSTATANQAKLIKDSAFLFFNRGAKDMSFSPDKVEIENGCYEDDDENFDEDKYEEEEGRNDGIEKMAAKKRGRPKKDASAGSSPSTTTVRRSGRSK